MTAITAYHGDMADYFADSASDNAYNAHTDRPAMLELAGDVGGMRILDVGCGAGHYAEALLARGAAEVVGLDGSETMLEHARRRLGEAAPLRLHDLEEPLNFLADASFDLVVMALVYHHVEARRQLLDELFRVLRPGGALLVSNIHPAADWRWSGGSYFADERVDMPFGGRWTNNYRRLTIEAMFDEWLGAGFVLERLREPRATEAARVVDPQRYEKTHVTPFFLTVRLRRPHLDGHGTASSRSR
jgi:SAM-dependent methyltransferase